MQANDTVNFLCHSVKWRRTSADRTVYEGLNALVGREFAQDLRTDDHFAQGVAGGRRLIRDA